MTATLFLSPLQFPFLSTLFSEPFSPLPFSFSSTPLLLKNPKPLHSLSSNATSFFLQDRSFISSTKNENNNNNGDDENSKHFDDATSSDINEIKIKMPTAPWMKGPLLLGPDEVLDLSKSRNNKRTSNCVSHKVDKSLTEKISGRRGKKAMKNIVQSIEKLKVGSDSVVSRKNLDDTEKNLDDIGGGFLLGQLKVDDRGSKMKKKIVQSIERVQVDSDLVDTQKNLDDPQKNWDEIGSEFLLGQLKGDGRGSKFGQKMPWEKEQKVVFRRVKREKVVTAAELSLDKELLERLRGEASKMRKWVKVKKAGVTQAVVDEVHSIWANNELVMLKFDLPLCRNMDRAREIVEIKTGGLVVWSKKDSLVAYRGCNYQTARRSRKKYLESASGAEASAFIINHHKLGKQSSNPVNMAREKVSLSHGHLLNRNLGIEPADRSLYEREGDRLLDGLGPRFIDWWYPKPLPVDADLLPEVVPGFKPPFRSCPYRVRPQLTDDELTYLRKLACPLPVHFVLGRNSNLQGLALAILKLWEKSIIAKIAIKWGVPNTNNELMASELKHLTGGVLLLRNKFFIILYRGKDFLPSSVANMVVEREMELNQWQLHEEDARLKAAATLDMRDKTSGDTSVVGTFSEFQHIQTMCGNISPGKSEANVKLEAEKERIDKELRKQEHKLAILKFKIELAEKELSQLNSAWKPSEQEPDIELITEEERECFREIGLKMDRVLVLGRRGVFDGVVEGLHQHWKHRELVKVITMQKKFPQVVYTARLLERESGGILVSIDRLKQGHSIIIYRGKNYRRPIDFGDNPLNKKKALRRSLEMQRVGSLKFFAHQRQKEITDLRLRLADLLKLRKRSD